MKRKIRVRLIREDAAVQPATFASDVDVEEVKEQEQETTETTETPTPAQQIDVDKLSDEEVMNYVYFNVPKDVDSSTLQSLHARADQIRQKRTNGNMSPQDQEKFANGIIAAAQQSKNVNESIDFVTKNLIDLFRGKLEERGRRGSLNWIGNNLYEEIEKDENGRIHYFNKWIGHIDRKSKTISINVSETTGDFVKSLKHAAQFANYKIQKTNEVRRLIDMGYEDDDFDPMYDDPELQTEAYSSGRVDTYNEPSWESAGFDEPDYDEEDFEMSLSVDVANALCNDFKLDEDTEGRVWAWVCDWLNQHKDLVRQRWQKKSAYSGNDQSEADIFIVKNEIEEDFKRKFKIK
jgi:hypothetical protein